MYIDYGYGLENCIMFDVLCTERNTILKTFLNYIYYLYINNLTRFKFFLFRRKNTAEQCLKNNTQIKIMYLVIFFFQIEEYII